MTTANTESNKQHRPKRIELVIVPGRSLGPFRLGSSLWDTLHFLSDRPQFFPSVELKYSQEEPSDHDFIIALPSNGINLRYDGSLQRLKSVECYDPTKVKLVYQNSDVSSSRTIPTFLLIYKSFGPTYPGEFDPNQSIYTLKYPGLAFAFPIPTRHQNLYKTSSDLPLEFPDGTTPIASKVILYSNSNTWQQAAVPPLPKILAEHNGNNSTKYGKSGKREVETVIVKPTKGITLNFPGPGSTDDKSTNNPPIINNPVIISLNSTTVQDILADLGKPSRIFYKEEDKMKIHSVNDHGNLLYKPPHPIESKTADITADDKDKDPLLVQPTDYFLNYFHLGIDLLIDGGLHICKKIVLHGNVPGHFDFQRYKRCPYQMLFPKNKNKNKQNNSVLVDVEDENVITGDMKITTMQELIPWETSNTIKENTPNGGQQKPVILTRGSSEQNPFGSTFLTGYDEGVVMEVMKNGHVPTIVLY
ncbi:hypothetical protein INT47_001039 [Mucor saturninus]|uniref:Uncharacterized protein n=1 Tax=Mucor saturninus TaxID=64648 RepID=A0A8H7UYB0_9FUNG|nr:hypothetical protein INT47_001039 [Mucor saturninus]